MGATSLGDADDEEVILNSENDREYLVLCGIMALQDEITRGSALRDLKSKLGSLNAGVRKRPKMVDGCTRKVKRKRKLGSCKRKPKCHNPSCQKQTPRGDDFCMIDNVFSENPKGRQRDRSRQKTRKGKEKKCKEICPLGVLELAVPSKRLCLETWRQYHHVLPPYAITRLKEIVLDKKPITDVSAAVKCFNLHKSKCKKFALKRKKEKMRRMLLAKNKKKTVIPNGISRICAKLAREVLYYLKTPKEVQLDSDWQRLSLVIFQDMKKMLREMDAKHLIKTHFLKDAAKKGAVWVGSILEQYEEMVVYDEIRDLEETEGPILDLLDEILEAVLDFCELSYKVRNSESALNYFSGDISLADEEGFNKESHLDDFRDDSHLYQKHGLEEAGRKYKLGIKLAEDYEDLDSDVRRDIIELAGEVTRSITDMAEVAVTKSLTEMEEARRKQLEDDIIILARARNAKSSDSDVEAYIDQEKSLNNDYENDSDIINSQTFKPADDMIKGSNDIIKETDEIIKGTTDINQIYPTQDEENVVQEIKANLESIENYQVNNLQNDVTNQEISENQVKREDTDIDQGENKDTYNSIPNQKPDAGPELTAQSNKYSKSHTEQSPRRYSNVTFQNQKVWKIGPINDDLLSDADEKWPKDVPFPVIKPSVSITQSITTLGNITESEETVKDVGELTKQLSEMISTTNDFEEKHGEKAEEHQKSPESDQHKELSSPKIISLPKELTKIEEFKDLLKLTTHDDTALYKVEPSVSKPKNTTDFTNPAEVIELNSKLKELPTEKSYKPKEIQQLVNEMERDMKNVEIKRQKLQEALSPTKKDTKTIFDYKVRPETAPSWSLKRVCSCRTSNKEYDNNLQTCVYTKAQMKNVFRESDNLVKSLELWNRWIASTCEQIITLKQNTDAAKHVEGRCSANRCIIRQWRYLQTNISQATKQWRHCKISSHNKLRRSQRLLLSKY